MKDPTIAFCTTCKGRIAHLKRSLPRNIQDSESYPKVKFIVLDYNSKDGLHDYLMGEHDVECGRLAAYRFTEPTPFRMAHAKNVAHRLGILEGADILVNMDADNYAAPGFCEFIAREFERFDNVFLWAEMIKEGPDRTGRGCSGRIVVSKKQFMLLGGYDEVYSTWSPDDKNFNHRLRMNGYYGDTIPREFINVILHNDKMRFREYPEAMKCFDSGDDHHGHGNPTSPIANYGKYGMGVVYKNDDCNPITLGPQPTRIFGIGMHKTGTTSLAKALSILGYDSAHWISAHWAKSIWEEMMCGGQSKTVNQHFALCDLPIPILYKELDKAYPGSKFILTIREDWEWLDSVRNHWSDLNPFRSQWSSDPFTHKVHKLLYGTKGFNPEIFIERYRRHNAEVREYFKGRPNDLLVMEMNRDSRRGAGWLELCGFLHAPLPHVPYPREFVTNGGC